MMEQAIKAIPGLMTKSELALLCRMARSAKRIVELGTYKGRSLAAMMLANPEAEAYGVDSFGDMSHRGYKGTTEGELRSNLSKLGLKPKAIYAMTTAEAAEQCPNGIDLLHIDAGHSYEEVKADIENWIPKVAPGGAVCFHDYGKPHSPKLRRPEVQKAVDEWRNDDWVEVERAGVEIAFRHLIAERGILYLAYGQKARHGAVNGVRGIRAHKSSLPVAVISDKGLGEGEILVWHLDCDVGARTPKTRMYALSPFRRTLYLDADTTLLRSPDSAFRLLDWFDVALGIDINKILRNAKWHALIPEEVQRTKEEIGTEEVLYYNSGVILFGRNERNRRMFQQWHTEWCRWRKQDQLAMIRAIHKCPVRIAPMREPWNTHRKSMARFIFHRHRTVARKGAPG